MQGFGQSRIRIRVGGSIEGGFEITNQPSEGRFIRPWPAGRRHQVAMQLLDNLLPNLGIDACLRNLDVLERQPPAPGSLVVAGDAIARDNRLLWTAADVRLRL